MGDVEAAAAAAVVGDIAAAAAAAYRIGGRVVVDRAFAGEVAAAEVTATEVGALACAKFAGGIAFMSLLGASEADDFRAVCVDAPPAGFLGFSGFSSLGASSDSRLTFAGSLTTLASEHV